MVNDKNWLRRSDEWVTATHQSRLKKERELIERNAQLKKQDLTTDSNTSSEKDTKAPTNSLIKNIDSNIKPKSLKKRKKNKETK
jgi:hypothetical protein